MTDLDSESARRWAAAKNRGIIMTAAAEREAARILASLIDHMHTTTVTARTVMMTATLPIELADRLDLWGAATENDEAEYAEPDPDFEQAVGW